MNVTLHPIGHQKPDYFDKNIEIDWTENIQSKIWNELKEVVKVWNSKLIFFWQNKEVNECLWLLAVGKCKLVILIS